MKHNLRQKGHVASEWVIVTFLMIMALFAPMPGTDQSVTGLMMESIKEFHASNSFLLSLP